MKIALGFPPLSSPKGIAALSQNRQFQWMKRPFLAYPVIMASLATMLKNKGHEVLWLDPIADEKSKLTECDIVLWETKTPTIMRTWGCVNRFKTIFPKTRFVLCGDHVTALPEESLNACECEIIKGGNYDEEFLALIGERGNWKTTTLDRETSKWRLYATKNGNFKYFPGSYTMFARDCWWRSGGGCIFCSWTSTFKNYSVMPVHRAMAEIENCASLGIREIFDDSGTFPIGDWLHRFCSELRKFNKGLKHGRARITMGCNMRPGALKDEDWKTLAASGFRFILFGLESSSQTTLDRLNKGQRRGDIEASSYLASKYGLEPHATCMVGYPWETREEALQTVELAKTLFKKGWIKTLQATLVIPYPGTKLFKECKENGWLRTEDWDDYDMSRPIMKCPISDTDLMAMTRGLYKAALSPQYILRALFKEDITTIFRYSKYFFSRLSDFS